MITFFIHKKFWLPIVMLLTTVILLELFFRTSWYNHYLNPKSLMGSAFNQISVLKKFGFDKIDWITIGDSKTDWGIDHLALRKAQRKNNINHIKFSQAGSNFMTLQSSAEWSIYNFKNLDGIMLGMYEYEFVHYSNPGEEYKISWPFRKYWDFKKFNYLNGSNFFADIIQKTAMYNYLPDIQDFLTNPFRRLKLIGLADKKWKKYLNLNKNLSSDLCEFNLSDLPSCVATANQLKGNTIQRGLRSIVRQCTTRASHKRVKNKQWLTPSIDYDDHFKNWANLFDAILEKDKKLALLLLPEHEYFEYMVKPSNAHKLIDKLVLRYLNNNNFILIDLRYLFNKNDECKYFSDTVHFNLKGAQKITKAIINKFND